MLQLWSAGIQGLALVVCASTRRWRTHKSRQRIGLRPGAEAGELKGWEELVKVEHYKRWVEVGGMRIPVLSLEYEYRAYLKMGRVEKAEMLRSWLQKTEAG